jgi:hypothetical protein
VCDHHTLRNTTDRPLMDVRIYIPVPLDDERQRISEFRIERDRPVRLILAASAPRS